MTLVLSWPSRSTSYSKRGLRSLICIAKSSLGFAVNADSADSRFRSSQTDDPGALVAFTIDIVLKTRFAFVDLHCEVLLRICGQRRQRGQSIPFVADG